MCPLINSLKCNISQNKGMQTSNTSSLSCHRVTKKGHKVLEETVNHISITFTVQEINVKVEAYFVLEGLNFEAKNFDPIVKLDNCDESPFEAVRSVGLSLNNLTVIFRYR